MSENEITFVEFWNIIEKARKIDVENAPSTDLPWDGKRIEAYILNQEKSGHSELHYYKVPFNLPVFRVEVRLGDRRVFLFRISK